MPLATTGPTPSTGPAPPAVPDGSFGGIVAGPAAGPPRTADFTPWPADPNSKFVPAPDMGKVDP